MLPRSHGCTGNVGGLDSESAFTPCKGQIRVGHSSCTVENLTVVHVALPEALIKKNTGGPKSRVRPTLCLFSLSRAFESRTLSLRPRLASPVVFQCSPAIRRRGQVSP